MLSAPLVLSLPAARMRQDGPWTIQPDQLAGMLAIQRADTPKGPRYQVGLSAKSSSPSWPTSPPSCCATRRTRASPSTTTASSSK